jgi:L-asparaginase II
MAILYARLGRPETLDGLSDHAARCLDAMLAEPYLVGGRDRVDTAVMKVTGTVVVKGGAEALYCASVPRAGLGIAVKIADGGSRAGSAALVRALERAGTLSTGELDALDAYARPPVMGGEGRVGELVADFDLRGSRQSALA